MDARVMDSNGKSGAVMHACIYVIDSIQLISLI